MWSCSPTSTYEIHPWHLETAHEPVHVFVGREIQSQHNSDSQWCNSHTRIQLTFCVSPDCSAASSSPLPADVHCHATVMGLFYPPDSTNPDDMTIPSWMADWLIECDWGVGGWLGMGTGPPIQCTLPACLSVCLMKVSSSSFTPPPPFPNLEYCITHQRKEHWRE